MVRIRFYGTARQVAGVEAVDAEVPEPIPLRLLLGRIIPARENAPSKWIESILLNGRNCIFLDGLDTLIRDGDTVEVLPAVLGG